jgi:cytochrome c oxidase subunit II
VVALVDTRKEFEDLANVYVSVAIAVAAIIIGSILVFVVVFRRRDDELPRQRDEAPRLELLYAGVLAVVVTILLVLTFRTQDRVDAVSPRPGLKVTVTAAKWNWRFHYPAQRITRIAGQTRPTPLVVPSDTTVRFTLTSLDVIHSLWIPEVRFKRDAFPKRTTQFDLVFAEPGFYSGQCAEFCGLKHSDMRFSVDVRTPEEFAAWAARKRRAE